MDSSNIPGALSYNCIEACVGDVKMKLRGPTIGAVGAVICYLFCPGEELYMSSSEAKIKL